MGKDRGCLGAQL